MLTESSKIFINQSEIKINSTYIDEIMANQDDTNEVK